MKEEGSSLLEVLIAVMILALAGTVLVGGLFMARVVTDRATVKREAIAQLDSISQTIASQPFIPCSVGSPTVYETPVPVDNSFLKDPNVTLKVEILDSATNTWLACGGSDSPNHGIQKVTIDLQANGQSYEKVIVKTRG